MSEAGEALELARSKQDPRAMVSAISLRARMNGLLVEDRRNDRGPLPDLTDEQLDAMLRDSMRELELAGVAVSSLFRQPSASDAEARLLTCSGSVNGTMPDVSAPKGC
jgi:hypothetical protein